MKDRRFIVPIGILLFAVAVAFARQPQPRARLAKPSPKLKLKPDPRPAASLIFQGSLENHPAGRPHPVTPDSLASTNLELKLYGDSQNILMNERNPPLHLFTGACETNCAVAFREKNNYADLTGHARIRWVTRTSGFHFVHPIVKLADGTWLVGRLLRRLQRLHPRLPHQRVLPRRSSLDQARYGQDRHSRRSIESHPNLSKVDEIGFTDLMPGSGMGLGGFACLGAIEVYGKPVPRDAVQTSAN